MTIPWKKLTACVALLYGMYKLLVGGSIPDGVFGFLIAAIAFLSEFNAELYFPRIRKFFKQSDRFARNMLVFIAVGGTALVIKQFFELQLISDQFDFLVKRSALPLVAICALFYATSFFSKLTLHLTDTAVDRSLRREEALFHLFVSLFSLSLLILNLGLPEWDEILGHKHNAELMWFDPSLIEWHRPTKEVLECFVLISAIWMLCFLARALSRYWELRFTQTSARGAISDGPVSRD